MSDAIMRREVGAVATVETWNQEQRDLIKRTVAPNATDDELAMFLHVAARSGLDPLRRQLHFLKVGGRLTFIADVNGLMARAAKEQDFEGLLHAVVYEKDTFAVDNTTGTVVAHTSNPLGANGKIIGAWATCFRRGMKPFTSVVRFAEYENSNNPLWKSKPGVMIDKTAKSTALRLAYPEQLGGIYDRAELDKLEEKEVNEPPPVQASKVEMVKAKLKAKLLTVGQEVTAPTTVTFGPHKGKQIAALSDAELSGTVDLGMSKLNAEPQAKWAQGVRDCLAHLEEEAMRRQAEPPPPFDLEPGTEG